MGEQYAGGSGGPSGGPSGGGGFKPNTWSQAPRSTLARHQADRTKNDDTAMCQRCLDLAELEPAVGDRLLVAITIYEPS